MINPDMLDAVMHAHIPPLTLAWYYEDGQDSSWTWRLKRYGFSGHWSLL